MLTRPKDTRWPKSLNKNNWLTEIYFYCTMQFSDVKETWYWHLTIDIDKNTLVCQFMDFNQKLYPKILEIFSFLKVVIFFIFDAYIIKISYCFLKKLMYYKKQITINLVFNDYYLGLVHMHERSTILMS